MRVVTEEEPEEIKPPIREARELNIELPDTESVEEAESGPATLRLEAMEDEAEEIKPVKNERA